MEELDCTQLLYGVDGNEEDDEDEDNYDDTVPLLFQHSSVQKLTINLKDNIVIETEALPHENTNLESSSSHVIFLVL